jgi:hypothetical protein
MVMDKALINTQYELCINNGISEHEAKQFIDNALSDIRVFDLTLNVESAFKTSIQLQIDMAIWSKKRIQSEHDIRQYWIKQKYEQRKTYTINGEVNANKGHETQVIIK